MAGVILLCINKTKNFVCFKCISFRKYKLCAYIFVVTHILFNFFVAYLAINNPLPGAYNIFFDITENALTAIFGSLGISIRKHSIVIIPI